MRQRIRFWFKLMAALTLAVALLAASSNSPLVELHVLGLKAMAINAFGTSEERDRLVEQTGRAAAIRNGMLGFYEQHVAFDKAVYAQQKLAQMDEALADAAIELALREREERHLMVGR